MVELNFKSYLETVRNEVNIYLAQCLEEKSQCPPVLQDAMKYSLLGKGKRLRAILAITVSRALHGEDQNVFPMAAALEMIHAYSLVHDDLPAIDNDDYRRGELSTHKKFGEAMGILTGDALLTHAFWVVAAHTLDKNLVAPLVETLAWAAGIGGMVSGQVVDILSTNTEPNAELVEFIHRNKTGALLMASCKSGAIAAKASSQRIQKIEDYGTKLGLAFQIVDDILDITSNTETLGKTAGKDVAQGKMTYPLVWGLDKARAEAKKLLDQACQSVRDIPDNAHLLALARMVLEREN